CGMRIVFSCAFQARDTVDPEVVHDIDLTNALNATPIQSEEVLAEFLFNFLEPLFDSFRVGRAEFSLRDEASDRIDVDTDTRRALLGSLDKRRATSEKWVEDAKSGTEGMPAVEALPKYLLGDVLAGGMADEKHSEYDAEATCPPLVHHVDGL